MLGAPAAGQCTQQLAALQSHAMSPVALAAKLQPREGAWDSKVAGCRLSGCAMRQRLPLWKRAAGSGRQAARHHRLHGCGGLAGNAGATCCCCCCCCCSCCSVSKSAALLVSNMLHGTDISNLQLLAAASSIGSLGRGMRHP